MDNEKSVGTKVRCPWCDELKDLRGMHKHLPIHGRFAIQKFKKMKEKGKIEKIQEEQPILEETKAVTKVLKKDEVRSALVYKTSLALFPTDPLLFNAYLHLGIAGTLTGESRKINLQQAMQFISDAIDRDEEMELFAKTRS